MRLGQQDVFLNVAGGLRVGDPALDLAVYASLFPATKIPLYPSKFALRQKLVWEEKYVQFTA